MMTSSQKSQKMGKQMLSDRLQNIVRKLDINIANILDKIQDMVPREDEEEEEGTRARLAMIH